MKVKKSGGLIFLEESVVSISFYVDVAKKLCNDLCNVLNLTPQTNTQQTKVKICPHHFELDILNKDDNKTEVLHCCKSLGKL